VSKSTMFWDITPCSPLKVNRRFGGTLRNHRFENLSSYKHATFAVPHPTCVPVPYEGAPNTDVGDSFGKLSYVVPIYRLKYAIDAVCSRAIRISGQIGSEDYLYATHFFSGHCRLVQHLFND
jgi:hypothetical protein